MTTRRLTRHKHIADLLASYPDDDLDALVATRQDGGIGVGGDSGRIALDDVALFVKRIPLTARELAHPHSTANLFDLPMFCQYGIGGPSLNGWRELAANLTVTNLVRSVATQAFAMLYHWRVLPGRAPVADDHADIDAAVAGLGHHRAVRARLEALADASSSFVLISEFLPRPVRSWLSEDPAGKAASVERQWAGIVTALADAELLHLDAHLENLRTDGSRIYLTDFGLATSPRFDLSADERAFVARNARHDADYASMRLVNWLVTAVCGVDEHAGVPFAARNAYVARCADGDVPNDVPATVAAILGRHAPAAARMNSLYWRLFGGDLTAQYGPAG